MTLWREISHSLESKILSRELTPGDKLPTEFELSREFMVNRHTVRRALSDLQEKGIVESTQGRGSYVRRPSTPMRLHRRPRFTEAVRERGRTPRTETLRLVVRPADAKVASQLGLRASEPVIYLERRRFIDGEPIGLSQHHFSYARFPTFVETYRARGTITQSLIDLGVPDYTRSVTRISARLPTGHEASLLRIPRHVPLLVQRYLNIDGLSRPLEYGVSRAANEVEIDFPGPD
jgi:GntR family transcriptional regulator, phosphonate transport system regulatory protein